MQSKSEFIAGLGGSTVYQSYWTKCINVVRRRGNFLFFPFLLPESFSFFRRNKCNELSPTIARNEPKGTQGVDKKERERERHFITPIGEP